MLGLYFSLSSSFLFLALIKNEKCLISVQKNNARRHSENFLDYLQKIFAKTNHSLKEINRIYFTSLPSGQTGIRITLAFLSALQVLNPQIKLYHINTLLLQVGESNHISLLTIDRRENKYYGAIYQRKNCLIKTHVIQKESLDKLTANFPTFPFLKDFQGVDFLINFQKLKNEFILLNNIEEIDN